jgi:hypothetical protein
MTDIEHDLDDNFYVGLLDHVVSHTILHEVRNKVPIPYNYMRLLTQPYQMVHAAREPILDLDSATTAYGWANVIAKTTNKAIRNADNYGT